MEPAFGDMDGAAGANLGSDRGAMVILNHLLDGAGHHQNDLLGPRLVVAGMAAARAIRPDVIVLCHGGPVAMPDDAGYILRHANRCHGFYGAFSMERLPVEQAIADQTRAFKALPIT